MDKLILDSTCSEKKIWPNYADIRIDKRKNATPDIVADCRYLPFRSEIFSEIYCDPPHMIRNDLQKYFAKHPERKANEFAGKYLLRFETFPNRKTWIDFVVKINLEFARCLTKNGALKFKITDGADHRITKKADLKYLTKFYEDNFSFHLSKFPWSKNKIFFVTLKLR